MITSLRLEDFKNFADETLHVGPFTVIVGANASGKSNIRDAFRFLYGIGRGYSLAEIAGGKHEAGWKPIRGATNEFARFRNSTAASEADRFSLEVEMKPGRTAMSRVILRDNAKYRIAVRFEDSNGGRLSVADEALSVGSEKIYTADIIDDPSNPLDRSKPALWHAPSTLRNVHHAAGQIAETLFRSFGEADRRAQAATDVASHLNSMRFFDFKPDRMREPAFPGQTTLGESGEYLPVVLKEICADQKRKSILASWLRELTPMDVEDFEFPSDPSGRIYLVICEANRARVSANCASDGTLRFLAMLAALLGEDFNSVYFFEEIENGLHPSRLHLLIDLIERVTADGSKQVIATTHSPQLLSLVNESSFESAAVVCRMEDTNEAIIRRIADMPNAKKLRKTQGLGRLLVGGWMETALAFTESNGDNEERSE